MNTREMKSKIKTSISSGLTKSQVFAQLSNPETNVRRLASLIAAHPDPRLRAEHNGKVTILLALMLVQSLLIFFAMVGALGESDSGGKWVVGALIAPIPLLFAWGFYRNVAAAYTIYIGLAIIQMPKLLEGATSEPISTVIAFALNVAMLAFVWYVRNKLFPDLSFLGPRKLHGQYVFTS